MPAGADQLEEKLDAALRALSNGETVDGQPLDLAKVAARAHERSQAEARLLAEGQRNTAQKLRVRRFKG